MARKKMSDKEKEDWSLLYNHVKNLMGYDESQALSKNMVLRLKGLSTNKFMENKRIEDTANYSYEVILNTFKYCSPELQKVLRTMSFVDEQHKFNMLLKIVERNINNVYMKMKVATKANEKITEINTSIATYTGVQYKSKELKKKKEDKFSDFW